MSSPWVQLRFRRDHRWTQLHLSAYLDSELRAQLRLRLERHTAECPQCRAILTELRRMLALFEAMPEPSVDGPAITTAVMQLLYESPTG